MDKISGEWRVMSGEWFSDSIEREDDHGFGCVHHTFAALSASNLLMGWSRTRREGGDLEKIPHVRDRHMGHPASCRSWLNVG